MKKILIIFSAVVICVLFTANIQAQTNTFPSTGNVGIGTLTPGALLDVYSTTAPAGIIVERNPASPAIANYATIQLKNGANATGEMYFIGIKGVAGGTYECVQSVRDATGVFKAFSVVNTATGKYEIRNGITNTEFLNSGNVLFNNTGAVGIGMGATAIPAGTKLAVAGKVSCKEVEVTLTGLPDFVFNQDYNLRSLYDVENFINQNKHLPDVPTESEVIKNGLNLGEMNATLLQKVEELTLYMIDLKKQNDILQARISKLEK